MGFSLTVRLGRGRTVETFAGTLDGRREVAVKRPRAELARNRAFHEALVTWGESLRKADHPNLVTVIDSGRRDDGAYVIEERVDGASLQRILDELKKRRRSLRPNLAISIAMRLSEGIEGLHRATSIPHGGVDPSDVLIGFDGRVKLADGGLHRLDPLAEAKQSTTYVAPEIAADPRSKVLAADAWGLGLVTLEMLIGHPLWTNDRITLDDAVLALQDFTHLGAAHHGLTERLVAFLRRCLETDPARRFNDGTALRETLATLAASSAIRADDAALGAFVKALLPPPPSHDALTMVAVPTMGERGDVEQASVIVDLAAIEQRAIERSSSRTGSPRPVAPDGRRRGPGPIPGAPIPLEGTEPDLESKDPALEPTGAPLGLGAPSNPRVDTYTGRDGVAGFARWLEAHGGVWILIALGAVAVVLFALVIRRLR